MNDDRAALLEIRARLDELLAPVAAPRISTRRSTYGSQRVRDFISSAAIMLRIGRFLASDLHEEVLEIVLLRPQLRQPDLFLAEHAARFPRGALANEREVARIAALCVAGRDGEARVAADSITHGGRPSGPITRALSRCTGGAGPR